MVRAGDIAYPQVVEKHKTKRRQTRQIPVGPVAISGDDPAIVQSMTSRPTGNQKATLDQIVRLSVAGCELVRVSLVADGPFVLEAARATGARLLPVDALSLPSSS